jgi:hypothetical protein
MKKIDSFATAMLAVAVLALQTFNVACDSATDPASGNDTYTEPDTATVPDTDNPDPDVNVEPDEVATPTCSDGEVELTLDGYTECVSPTFYHVATEVLTGTWENVETGEQTEAWVKHIDALSPEAKKAVPEDVKWVTYDWVTRDWLGMRDNTANNRVTLIADTGKFGKYDGEVVESDNGDYVNFTRVKTLEQDYSFKKISD